MATPRSMLAGLVLGLLFIAAVPGVGWKWGQVAETITLCAGIACLIYAGAGYMLSVNARLATLEWTLSERDHLKK